MALKRSSVRFRLAPPNNRTIDNLGSGQIATRGSFAAGEARRGRSGIQPCKSKPAQRRRQVVRWARGIKIDKAGAAAFFERMSGRQCAQSPAKNSSHSTEFTRLSWIGAAVRFAILAIWLIERMAAHMDITRNRAKRGSWLSKSLAQVLGHEDRAQPLRDYCTAFRRLANARASRRWRR